ncbi:MAG TPA: hypothetical protein VMH86_00760 [Rhizomicrobium sp.]|nr:hypothetical protein [Rhizomicrobium sp.]
MASYTVSTYQYTDTNDVPGFAVDSDHSTLTVTGAGSIVTGGTGSDGIDLTAAYGSLLLDGAVTSRQATGVYVGGSYAYVGVHADIYGANEGIDVALALNHVNVVVSAGATVTGHADEGIDLMAAYSHLTVSGTVASDLYDYAITAGGTADTLTVSSHATVDGGIDLYSPAGTLDIAGTVTSSTGAVYVHGDLERVTVSGSVTGYSGMGISGSYGSVRITGDVDGTGSDGQALYVTGIGNHVVVGASGTLEGAGLGANLYDGYANTLTNNGHIDGYGVQIFAGFNNTFVNHGTVSGGVYVYGSAGVHIVNTGTIQSQYDGFYAGVASVEFDNSGTVDGDLYCLPTRPPAHVVASVSVENSGTWTATEIFGGYYNTFHLVNSGSIYFKAGYGGGHDDHFGLYAPLYSTFVNKAGGTIGGEAGSHIDFYGASIDNAGTISLPINFGGTLVNETGGVIDGHVEVYYGSVLNYGEINGSVVGAATSAGATVVNYGTIERVTFAAAGYLYNYGTITGHVTGSAAGDTLIAKNSHANWFNGNAGDDKLGGGGAGDTLYGGSGNDVIRGNGGNDIITGGNGADVITGGFGNDTMTGGAGGDKFIFAAGFGQDVVTDFTTGGGSGHDLIDFKPGTFADFASVQAAMSIDGNGDVVITLDAADTITLTGVHNTGDLVAANFGFT